MIMKVAIIGCGHGGQALAADLTQRDCKVSLYAHPKHLGGYAAIKKAGGILCQGLIQGFTPIAQITTNLQQAVDDCEYIFIVLPSYAHEAMFIELMPFIKPGQTIITLAANFAALSYLKLLEQTNRTTEFDMIDMASLPYVCRSDFAGSVEIMAVKNKLALASIPAAAIDKHVKRLSPLFPCQLLPYQDVLSLGMNITSGMTHPAITLLNAGRIGSNKEIFYFYRDGITPEIATLIEQLDLERMQIGKRFGLKMHAYLDLMQEYYGVRYESVYDFFRESPPHNALPLCPRSLQERYITQDVAGLLVPWYCLGKLAQCESSILATLINLSGLLNKTNYLRTGTNLVRLNLHDKTIEGIKLYSRMGVLPSSLTAMQDIYLQCNHAIYPGNVA